MKAIVILEVLYDYTFQVGAERKITFSKENGSPSPADRDKIAGLLDTIRAQKEEAIDFLNTRTDESNTLVLMDVAEDIVKAARKAGKRGDLYETRRLWKQHARIMAVIEPVPSGMSWDEFASL